jgi:hypothetical protein
MEKKFKKEIEDGDLDFRTQKWHTSLALFRQVTKLTDRIAASRRCMGKIGTLFTGE